MTQENKNKTNDWEADNPRSVADGETGEGALDNVVRLGKKVNAL